MNLSEEKELVDTSASDSDIEVEINDMQQKVFEILFIS